MKVNVGSTNPVKINAVLAAFSKYWPDCIVEGVEVDSGVSHMPRTDDDSIQGAINRARACIGDADYGVGLEGGIMENSCGMFLSGWAVVIDKSGEIGIGNSGYMQLPEKIAEQIRDGKELGPVMDSFTNTKDVKKKGGAISFFTSGRISRTDSFERAIILALVKFINNDSAWK